MQELSQSEVKVPALIFSRVVGYFSAVNKDWNPGKLSEWKDRRPYSLDKAMNKILDKK